MQRKTLTTNNGIVLQLTLSPFEILALRKMAAHASIPLISSSLSASQDSVGRVIRDFYTLLDGQARVKDNPKYSDRGPNDA